SPFVRYERYNTQASVDAGYTADPLNDETVVTAGANFNLSREVVFKADWQNYKTDNKKDRFNLGVGYMF
ncbi:MAG TPA: porin, partial [Betaproteobacteria bacterium]|nr:porin [Betaproteobacteria bacterium]